MKKNEKTVAEVLLPASVDKVEANSNFSPWSPGKVVKAEKPVIISATEREREVEGKKVLDVMIVFKVAGYTCKTYASTLKGLFQSKFGVSASPFKAVGKGRAFVEKLMIGYVANTSPTKDRFPVNMEVTQR